MRYILLLFFLFLVHGAYAQRRGIIIKAQNKSITAGLNEDNTGKVLVINSKAKLAKTDKFTVYNADWRSEKDWIRHFEIFDETGNNSIKRLPAVKQARYEIPLNELLKSIKKNQTCLLYTMALPADPDKAATIRVRRILICKMIVK